MKKYSILLAAFMALGCANNSASNTLLELEGGIYMKGLSKSSFLSIKDKKTGILYKIQTPTKFNLNHRQKEVVQLKAKLIKEAVGPGFPAVIEVIKVKN